MDRKLCGKKEKLLVRSNFSFSHSVFKRLLMQTRKNQGLFGKGLSFQKKKKKRRLTGSNIFYPCPLKRVLNLFAKSINPNMAQKVSPSLNILLSINDLRYFYPEDVFFFSESVISVISVVIRETTLTISNSTGDLDYSTVVISKYPISIVDPPPSQLVTLSEGNLKY